MQLRWEILGAAALAAGCGGDHGATPAPGGDAGQDDASLGTARPDSGGTGKADARAPDGGDAGGTPPVSDSGSSAACVGGSGDPTGGTPTVGGIFQQPEPWTVDVSGVAADPCSDAMVGALSSMGGWGGGKLQIDFSIPIFSGDASTPRRTVTALSGMTYCYGGPDCDAVPLQMPVPAGGNIEGSSNFVCDTSYQTDGQGDCHLLVVATDENKLYELYNATEAGSASGLSALGAFVWDLTKAYPSNLRGDQCTSADAAGFPIGALLPTADEVAAGAVNHAIRFILPNARMKKDAYVHPATHAGSPSSTNPNAPPYGVRLRLKASFDETPYSAGEKVILAAMKKYGLLLSDGGTIALTFADDRTSTAKWDAQGVTAQSFAAIGVDSFEVVDLTPDVALTDDCVRNP
jgi:hypothetical protein